MKKTEGRTKKARFRDVAPRFGVAAGLLAAAGALMALFANAGYAFFPAYRVFSKGIEGTLAFAASIAPFSLWDFITAGLVAFALGSLAFCVIRKRSVWKWLANLSLVLAALAFFLVGAWGLNHYAPPLADDLGLEVREYSAGELEAATAYYLEKAAALAQSIPRDADMVLERQDFRELATIAGASYTALWDTYPILEGSTAPVKELLLAGEPLLYSGHTGIFWPFTGEANVPANCAVSHLPFTMCHEAAHRLGIASEQEANFAAFLACTQGSASEDARFTYSGYYEAFGYCLNALTANYPDRAQALIEQAIGEEPDPSDAKTYGARLVLYDRANTQAYYQAYKGPAEEVGTAANDAYLKAFSEESGVKSYGEVVDYLIAWHQRQ